MSACNLRIERVKCKENQADNETDMFEFFPKGFNQATEQLDHREVLVGRLGECDLQLDTVDPPCLISRHHAKMTAYSCGKIFVEDLQSKNGTYVNNKMLKPHSPQKLNVGDTVTFGCISPKSTILPGTVVIQENALFNYILKGSPKNCKEKLDSTVSSMNILPAFPSTPMQDQMKPIQTSTPHCSYSEKEETNPDSGIVCNDHSTSSSCETPVTRQKCPRSSLAPKLRAKLSYVGNYMDVMSDTNDSETSGCMEGKKPPLPLTVSNLIAYSGCKFNSLEIETSSDEKENKVRKATSPCDAMSSHSNNTTIELDSGKKRMPKRKRASTFTRKKRPKKDDESEACSHFECKVLSAKSKGGNFVSWVQCDSCDKWFHTECVGCDYNKVKLKSHQFQCGLC